LPLDLRQQEFFPALGAVHVPERPGPAIASTLLNGYSGADSPVTVRMTSAA
jgi:hypothetical protein